MRKPDVKRIIKTQHTESSPQKQSMHLFLDVSPKVIQRALPQESTNSEVRAHTARVEFPKSGKCRTVV